MVLSSERDLSLDSKLPDFRSFLIRDLVSKSLFPPRTWQFVYTEDKNPTFVVHFFGEKILNYLLEVETRLEDWLLGPLQ
jgi:hypothetical protein